MTGARVKTVLHAAVTHIGGFMLESPPSENQPICAPKTNWFAIYESAQAQNVIKNVGQASAPATKTLAMARDDLGREHVGIRN